MGLFHSSPANNSEERHSLGAHGPSLAPRRGRRLNWWEVLKLGAVTVSVGALQWLKIYFLMLEDREAQQRLRRRLGRHSRQERPQEEEQKGFASNLSPESRQAVISMIDHIVTPMLVDQWRLGLVKVLLDPEEGPVLPEENPDMRKALLASLQSYQSERDARPTFRPGSIPPRYNRPSAQSSQPSSSRQAQGQSEASSSLARGREALAMASLAQASHGSNVFAEHHPSGSTPAPSAPPLYPEVQHPSAPPLSAEWQMVEPPSEKAAPEPEECGVCLDANVEVEIDNCHHKLCCECAKAICCLEGRAPQCPFCRGAMTGVTAVVRS